jgi:hypothetical protein
MRFQTFININFSILLLSTICLPKDTTLAALPKDTTLAALPKDTTLAALPKDTTLAALPKDTTLAALPKDTTLAALPKDTTLAALPKDTTLAALTKDAAFISMAGECRYPTIASEGNSIYMAWLLSSGNTANLYFKRSVDEGKDWNSSQRISNENGNAFPPALAVNSGMVHLAWMDYGETIDGEIYYTRSPDSGKTWEKNFILVGNANSARYPLITCRDKNVYLIWQDVGNQVFFKASHDQGRTWGNETILGKVGKHSCYCYPPSISCNGNDLVVAWTDFKEDKRGFHIKALGIPLYKSNDKMISSLVCRRSTNNGNTWGKELILTTTKLSKETKEEIDNPIMLSDGSLSYIFWLDKRNVPLGEIFYARFDPATEKGIITGKTLYPVEKRSPKRPSVVFDKVGNLHFTWASFFGGESIVSYGAIDPAGNILKEKKDLTSNAGRYHNPIITRTPSGLMHVFWFDEPKDKEKWSRIFLKTSKDNGATWEYWEPQKKEM